MGRAEGYDMPLELLVEGKSYGLLDTQPVYINGELQALRIIAGEEL